MRWTTQELDILKDYASISKYYICNTCKNEELVELQIIYLEAKLFIYNKNVVGYIGEELKGIWSFNKAQEKMDLYIQRGLLFTYHPINFKDMEEYDSFAVRKGNN